MKLIKLNLADTKFAFLLGNRKVNENKLLKAIRKAGQVLLPIYGVYYRDIKDQDIVLVDARSGDTIEDPADDTFVVLDGQHRTVCALRLFKESQASQASEDSSLCESFCSYIYANILDAEEKPEINLISRVMELGTPSQSWKASDFISSAHARKEDDQLITTINYFKELGFSISNTSRLLFFDHKVLTSDTLTKYANGEDYLTSDANCERGLGIYRMLKGVGFSDKFISKRYMMDAIIKRNNKGELNTFLNAISMLRPETVKEIENLKPVDYDNGKIQELVMNSKSQTQEDVDVKPYVVSDSPERFEEDIEFLHQQVEEVLAKRAESIKKRKSSQSSKTTCNKSLNEKYDYYSLNDIK